MYRAEVITVERRRRWSWSDKQQIVEETLMPGASISAVARRYGLHPSQLFAWRKAVREEGLAAGAIAGWALHPLEKSPPCHGARGKRSLQWISRVSRVCQN
jgi:transposase-like protein